MRFHIKDALWMMLAIAICLGWWFNAQRQAEYITTLERLVTEAQARQVLSERHAELAASECRVMVEEVRRLRGLVKSSVGDQRDWFELEVDRKRLIAIHPATSQSRALTLQTVEKIESATGLKATRLRHFLIPISELQLNTR